ncbi:MAG TPA: hypothetical protein VE912_19345 [Bacteroidales bacterium]|nr:hypothetical protein [Bacteroidales bacterium]
MEANLEKLRSACLSATTAFSKLNDPAYRDIQSKLEYCIGSFDFDKNPTGLYEAASEAYHNLQQAKQKYPRKFNKKIITDLERTLPA